MVLRSLRVLVVDDDDLILTITKGLLSRAGFEVETRARALGTTPYVLQTKPDVVLLDLSMPGIDGAELARALKERVMGTSVILHSSQEASDLGKIAHDVGAIGSIPKGLSPTEFVRRFNELAARRPS